MDIAMLGAINAATFGFNLVTFAWDVYRFPAMKELFAERALPDAVMAAHGFPVNTWRRLRFWSYAVMPLSLSAVLLSGWLAIGGLMR